MSAFPITIDATQLHHNSLLLWSGDPIGDWFETKDIQSVQLEPGTYKFQTGSGSFADFHFNVTSKGLVDYDKAFKGYVEGKGSSNLTLKGCSVTFDARYISSTELYLIELYLQSDFISHPTWNLLPGQYSLIVGSGIRANFNFILKNNGTFAYTDKGHECKPDGSGGFLRGGGTSTLEFLGYPVVIDARAAGGDGVGLEDPGLPFVTSAVQFTNLLPASGYKATYNSQTGEFAVFHLDVKGKIILPPEIQPPIIQVKKFHNLPLLVIVPPRP